MFFEQNLRHIHQFTIIHTQKHIYTHTIDDPIMHSKKWYMKRWQPYATALIEFLCWQRHIGTLPKFFVYNSIWLHMKFIHLTDGETSIGERKKPSHFPPFSVCDSEWRSGDEIRMKFWNYNWYCAMKNEKWEWFMALLFFV